MRIEHVVMLMMMLLLQLHIIYLYIYVPFFVFLVYKYAKLTRRDVNDMNTRWTHALYLYWTVLPVACCDVFRVLKQYSGTRHCEGFCIIFDLLRCHYGHATKHCVVRIYYYQHIIIIECVLYYYHHIYTIYFHIGQSSRERLLYAEGWYIS